MYLYIIRSYSFPVMKVIVIKYKQQVTKYFKTKKSKIIMEHKKH